MSNAMYDKVLEAMQELKTLIDALPDDHAQKEALRAKRNELRVERDRLIGGGLDEGSADYEAATAALDGGIADIKAAIADNAKIAGLITKIGQVVTAVSSAG